MVFESFCGFIGARLRMRDDSLFRHGIPRRPANAEPEFASGILPSAESAMHVLVDVPASTASAADSRRPAPVPNRLKRASEWLAQLRRCRARPVSTVAADLLAPRVAGTGESRRRCFPGAAGRG